MLTETPLHYVTVEHRRDDDGEIARTTVTFECRGDRTSSCHQYPVCDCESWSDEHDKEHTRVPHDECGLQDWFDDASCGEECYDHDDSLYHSAWDIPERSGPIQFEWDECISWSFLPEDVTP